MDKFWMLYVEGGGRWVMEGVPLVEIRYLSHGQAEEEAEKLARQTRKPVYVLEAVGVCQLEEQSPSLPPVRWERVGASINSAGRADAPLG